MEHRILIDPEFEIQSEKLGERRCSTGWLGLKVNVTSCHAYIALTIYEINVNDIFKMIYDMFSMLVSAVMKPMNVDCLITKVFKFDP